MLCVLCMLSIVVLFLCCIPGAVTDWGYSHTCGSFELLGSLLVLRHNGHLAGGQ